MLRVHYLLKNKMYDAFFTLVLTRILLFGSEKYEAQIVSNLQAMLPYSQ